jgi:hypothetical protein
MFSFHLSHQDIEIQIITLITSTVLTDVGHIHIVPHLKKFSISFSYFYSYFINFVFDWLEVQLLLLAKTWLQRYTLKVGSGLFTHSTVHYVQRLLWAKLQLKYRSWFKLNLFQFNNTSIVN